MTKRVAIIGGGISGLSAAYYLERERAESLNPHSSKERLSGPPEYELFEASPRLGGVMWTERVEGCLIEAGPDSFLSEKQSAAVLCRDLGIADQLVGSNDNQRKTYILVRGRLVPMPDGLMFMVPTKLMPTVTTRLFLLRTKLRMAREFFAKPMRREGDESAAEFVERHFGAEVVDRLADPLLSGVYGGDAARLSVRAVLPRFVEMEAKYGSLSRAMLAAMKKRNPTQSAKDADKGGAPSIFTSMFDGMQQLVDAVVAQLPQERLHTRAEVTGLTREGKEWQVGVEGGVRSFDRVIIATPAYVAGALLKGVSPKLAGLLEQIAYSSSVTVALGYEAANFDGKIGGNPPDGFGFLVPRSEGKRLLACTFVHNKFPHRAPPDKFLLRVFLGGARDEAALELSDEEILRTVRDELYSILKLRAQPVFARVYRWKRSMAQYEVGHLERVAEIKRLESELPGLSLIGNAYSGIGVPDCIRMGMEAVHL
ncbi:MAG: protoporphyrinogen oxidase [Acidobacteria bacterium]|nr:protoporphyrinogen oxidase [Acidobacteriota bacterium]